MPPCTAPTAGSKWGDAQNEKKQMHKNRKKKKGKKRDANGFIFMSHR